MNKIALIAGLAVASAAIADEVLLVDLTVANQITISSTGGNASVSATGSDFTGWLLEGLFGSQGPDSYIGSPVVGNLTTANNGSNNAPDLFQGVGSLGLNVWDVSNDATLSVTGGSAAFSGSATWTLTAAQYAAFSGGQTMGNVWLGADTDDDIGGSSATNIGTYRVVPTPSSLALLGLGGLAAARRRR